MLKLLRNRMMTQRDEKSPPDGNFSATATAAHPAVMTIVVGTDVKATIMAAGMTVGMVVGHATTVGIDTVPTKTVRTEAVEIATIGATPGTDMTIGIADAIITEVTIDETA